MNGVKVAVLRLALALALALFAGICLTSWPREENSAPNLTEEWGRAREGSQSSSSRRSCTVDELLPGRMASGRKVSSEWSHESLVEPPYGCGCASSKGRYFCPNLGIEGYPKWAPRAVAEGVCESRTREEMVAGRAPLPPDFKVLFYGNSYMRQAVEAILCLFERDLTSKRVRFKPPPETNNNTALPQQQHTEVEERTVPGDEPCRACSKWHIFRDILAESGCIAGDGAACRCDDDRGEFFFSNGAVAHFFFADVAANKTISDALVPHGTDDFSSYDAVFANEGNDPPVEADAVVEAALELRALGVPFFWLSTYEGKGDPEDWNERQGADFYESGARFVRVGDMAHGLDRLTRRAVEQPEGPDPHFCMPGVPDEIGLLLLKLVWAVAS